MKPKNDGKENTTIEIANDTKNLEWKTTGKKRTKWTTETFIYKLNKIHKNKYDYSKVNYITSNQKITIICPIHGEFHQKASHHLNGVGCSKCNFIKLANINRSTLNEFIYYANKIHNNKYDYSKSNYINRNKKLIIICQKHGEFQQTPNAHKRGQGCPKCGLKILSDRFTPSTKDFVNNAIQLHKNKYDYSKVNYINSHTKICIICQKHGEFQQTPDNHLQGKGCSDCRYENNAKLKLKTKSEILNTFKKIHGNLYDYSKFIYEGISKKSIIICRIHGEFLQDACHHINRQQGCPRCNCGYTISKPEIEFLNYLKIPDTKESRQKRIIKYDVDGYDGKTNVIYEFLGDYYHGNPMLYESDRYNKTCHKTFGQLYNDTLKKLEKLKLLGYTVKYIWELDWKKFKKGIDIQPNIITL